MKKLLSLLLILSLALSPIVPARAAPFEELDPPLWYALWEYSSREEYLFVESLSAEDYIGQVRWMRDYLAAHPEQDRDFDADDYYANVLWGGDPLMTKASWMDHRVHDDPSRPYGDADFQAEMKARWLLDLWLADQAQLHQQALAALYPEDFAAFDADAWFSAYYAGHPTQEGKGAYLAQNALEDEDAFRRNMFALCCDGTYSLGSFSVALDGVPMDFSPNGGAAPMRAAAGPRWQGLSDLPLVPARTFGEAMGCTVAYEADTGSLTLSRDGRTAVFSLDSDACTVDGAALTLPAQVRAYEGRCYLPLPVLADFLGLTWAWNGPRSAVFLQTTDKD